jgi:predicted nucleic acid-binding protein
MRKVIVNSTPIIGLANIGKLDLLRLVYQKITIPQAVFDELISPSVRQQVLKNRDWIQVEHIQDASQKQMYRAKLHAGEVEVMILAQEKKADLVLLDDNAAKKTAKYLGLPVTGTLGLLLRAKREGYIDAVIPVMDALEKDGFFIRDSVRQMVTEQAGE